jgi:hypothetical protein
MVEVSPSAQCLFSSPLPHWQADTNKYEGGAPFKMTSTWPNPYYLKQSQKSIIPVIKTVPVKMQAIRFITMKFKDTEKIVGYCNRSLPPQSHLQILLVSNINYIDTLRLNFIFILRVTYAQFLL